MSRKYKSRKLFKYAIRAAYSKAKKEQERQKKYSQLRAELAQLKSIRDILSEQTGLCDMDTDDSIDAVSVK